MTNQEAIEMMKAKLECMTREVSGVDLNCNAKKCDECDLCYAQGNMGEQKEWLRMGIEALENQSSVIEELKKIKAEIKDEEYSTNWLVSADVEKGWNEAVEYAIGKIDNHIEKLKGEVE